MKQKIFSYILVSIQVSTIAFMLITGDWFASNTILLTIEILGILLAVYALYTMRKHLTALPLIRRDSRLITSGAYRIIRHPMYTSILMAFIPLLIHQFTYARLIAMIIMVTDLIIKLQFEERLLLKHFDNYAAYMKKTYRIIPFLY